jgi:hypothetical protein
MRTLRASLLVLALPVALSGCMTMSPAAYMVSPDVKQSLAAYQGAHVHVDSMAGPPDFDAMCRAVGNVRIEHDLTVPQFVQKAFNDEFRYGGVDGEGLRLKGRLTRVAFSSSVAAVNGYWDLALALESSNGRSMTSEVHYEFEAGFAGITACSNTSLALAQAAQALVRKTVADPRFSTLIRQGT